MLGLATARDGRQMRALEVEYVHNCSKQKIEEQKTEGGRMQKRMAGTAAIKSVNSGKGRHGRDIEHPTTGKLLDTETVSENGTDK